MQQLLTTQDRVVPVPASGNSINSTTSLTTHIYSAMDYPETYAQLTAAMLADVAQEDQPADILAASISERRANKERSVATTQTLASPLKAECPSGNCVWKPYYALDICTQCRTTTKELTLKNLSPKGSDLSAMISAFQGGELSSDEVLTSNFTWEITPKSGQTWQVASNLAHSFR